MVISATKVASCPHVLRSFTQSDPSTLSPPSIFIPTIFINLQIPLPATPFFSHLYKTAGGVGVSANFKLRDRRDIPDNSLFSCIYELFVSHKKLKCFLFSTIH